MLPTRFFVSSPGLASLAALVLCAGACDPAAVPPDAPAIDAFVRADAPVPRPDAPPPMCASPCGTAETCCDVAGVATCVVTGTDPTNCGACGVDCLALGQGDACALGTCTCGDIDIGCLGGPRSTCCLGGGGTGRCADVYSDFDDCGGCGDRCDATTADRCSGGECACGEEDVCGAGSTCCAPRFGGGPPSCVDLGTDRENCGECQNTCSAGDLCVGGVCMGRDAGPRDAGAAPDAGADAP